MTIRRYWTPHVRSALDDRTSRVCLTENSKTTNCGFRKSTTENISRTGMHCFSLKCGRKRSIGTPMVIFAVLTVSWLFLTIGTLLVPTVYQQCRLLIVKNSQKTVKHQKMTIGVPIVTCLHRVRRIHNAAMPSTANTERQLSKILVSCRVLPPGECHHIRGTATMGYKSTFTLHCIIPMHRYVRTVCIFLDQWFGFCSALAQHFLAWFQNHCPYIREGSWWASLNVFCISATK